MMKPIFKLSSALSFIVLASLSNAYSLQVTIQPIQVANTNGSNLSPETAYRDYVTKIYAQADIGVVFLSTNFVNNSSYNHMDYNNAFSLVSAPGHGQSADPLTINAFFVDQVLNASVYGFAYLNQPYMVMDTTNILNYSGLGRVDTFSHELGHNLNLPHWDDAHGTGAPSPDHLMASGGIRNIPQSLGDVAPDGEGWDLLSADEIAVMRSSKFARPVPEPASLVVLGAGLAVLARRRRQS